MSTSRMFRGILLAIPLLGIAACGEPRPATGSRRCLNWKDDLSPELGTCKECHSPNFAYQDLVSGPSPRAVPGDAQSPLLIALADDKHASVKDVVPSLTRWVVECDIAYERNEVHQRGFMNPNSTEFHGDLVKNAGWDFDQCKKCHGDDFKGGASGYSCYTCHEDGPTGCTTCHGQPPKTGAHLAHITGGDYKKKVACDTCHPVPKNYRDAGHLDGKVDLKIAGWNGTSCDNVSCHSNVQTPPWVGGKIMCGGCHTIPPSTHPESYCAGCHPKVVDANKQIIDFDRHIDGKVSLGDESGSACGACHKSVPVSGSHTAHLTAEHQIAKPFDCSACHDKPAQVLSKGHGDGTVEVTSGYDAATNQCTSSCHGTKTQTWGGPPVECGSCHAIPPADSAHAGATLLTCYKCHPSTVDANGTLIPGSHVNGVVDVTQ